MYENIYLICASTKTYIFLEQNHLKSNSETKIKNYIKKSSTKQNHGNYIFENKKN